MRRARIVQALLLAVLATAAASVVAHAQGPAAAVAPAATVKITITAVPVQKRVFVFWGKKRLGMIAPKAPLILQRPRDSGPLDLLVQCEGFVTVQTRAYTFADTKLIVKLTPVDQKNTLLGYREEVPPEPDAGVPPAPTPGVVAATPGGGVPPPGVAAPPPGVAAPPPGVAAPPAAAPPAAAPRPDAGAR